jgi:hypothetical protein
MRWRSFIPAHPRCGGRRRQAANRERAGSCTPQPDSKAGSWCERTPLNRMVEPWAVADRTNLPCTSSRIATIREPGGFVPLPQGAKPPSPQRRRPPGSSIRCKRRGGLAPELSERPLRPQGKAARPAWFQNAIGLHPILHFACSSSQVVAGPWVGVLAVFAVFAVSVNVVEHRAPGLYQVADRRTLSCRTLDLDCKCDTHQSAGANRMFAPILDSRAGSSVGRAGDF